LADLIVTNINGQSELLTDYKNLRRRRKVNGELSITFLLLLTERNEHSFNLVQEESIIELEGQEYRIKKAKRRVMGETPVKYIEAHHVLFDLIDNHIYEKSPGTKTIQEALTFALAGSGYTYTVIDAFGTADLGEFGGDNSLSLVGQICDTYGAEIEENNTHLTLRSQIGADRGVQIRRGYNLITIEEDVDTSNLSTYIKGYGKENEDGTYVVEAEYTSPNASIFGIRHADPIYDGRYTTVQGMLERLQKELIDAPQAYLKLTFAEMKKAGYPYDTIEKGDVIYAIDEILGIDYPVRVTSIDDSPEEKDPNNMVIEISNYSKSITDYQADFENVRKQLRGILNGDGKVRYNVLDEAVKIATESLKNASTELEFPDSGGIIGRSKTNPNHLTVFNSNGFGISRNGGQTFQEAITADGFVLSVGAIGQLSANNIDVTGTIVAINSEGSTLIDGGKIMLSSNPDFTGATTYIDSSGVYTGTIEAVTGDFKGDLASAEVMVKGYSIGFDSNILMETGGTHGIRLRAYGLSDNPNLAITRSAKGNIVDEVRFNQFKVNADTAWFTRDVSISEDLTVNGTVDINNTLFADYLSIYWNATIGGILQANGGISTNSNSIDAGSGGIYGGFGSFTTLQSSGTLRGRGLHPDAAGESSFVYLVSSNGVRCATSFAGTSYVNIQAANVGTSRRDTKTDIIPAEINATEIINNTPIYNYYLRNEVEEIDELGNPTGVRREVHNATRKTGTILEEAPAEIAEPDHDMINLYSMVSISWLGHQEKDRRISDLEQRIQALEQIINSGG
jgi:phage minor structural protein